MADKQLGPQPLRGLMRPAIVGDQAEGASLQASAEALATPRFVRSMHGFGALMITLSALSPSIGVFVAGSDVIHEAGTGAVICFIAAAVLGVAIACVYAELSSAFPESGGEYTMAGRTLSPGFGFAALGLNLANFPVAQAVSALGVAAYLRVALPAVPLVPAAVVLILVVNVIAILNIRVNAWITGVFLSLEAASLGLVAWLGATHLRRPLLDVMHPVMLSGGHLVPVGLGVLGTAAAGAIFAFDGYGSVVYIGEEIHEAPHRVAQVVFWALGLGAVLMLIPVLTAMAAAPDLARFFAAETPLAAFVRDVGGHGVADAMSLAVALAIFNAMICIALLGARLAYASGRDGVWPRMVSQDLAKVHPRFGSPWVATLVMGAAGVGFALLPMDLLVTFLGSGVAFTYALLSLGVLRGRRTGASGHAPFRMPLYPVAPVFALIVLAGVMVTALMDPVSGRPGLLANAALMLAVVLYWHFGLKPRGGWEHKGPHALGAAE
jgi:amino acid transporter